MGEFHEVGHKVGPVFARTVTRRGGVSVASMDNLRVVLRVRREEAAMVHNAAMYARLERMAEAGALPGDDLDDIDLKALETRGRLREAFAGYLVTEEERHFTERRKAYGPTGKLGISGFQCHELGGDLDACGWIPAGGMRTEGQHFGWYPLYVARESL
ncbi:MAG: hypothetical protein H6R10_581 [Rhodocyclaceae bacterium]|nr:hypothetical protein [Rhodocyclaceae bacterium]